MTRARSLSSFLVLVSFLIGITSFSFAADKDFFKGKTIRFVVGFSPGGGFDTYTRLIARHFSKHVPGNPGTLVQNMTGAGSLIAANYIYNKAKPDGLTVGNWIGPQMLQALIGGKGRKFDSSKFGWLGVPVEDTGVCALTKQSGIHNAEDWLKSKKTVTLGATGPGSTTDDPPKILAAVTPFPIKIVEGYSGTATIRVAAERGEVAGGCWAWQSIKPTWRQGLESGNVRVIVKFSDHPDLKDVPSVYEFAKTDQDKKLLDVATDAYGAIARPYSLPPGVPPERVKILQTAFMDTLKDPELLAEAKKAKIEVNPHDGAWVAKKVAALNQMDDKMRSRLKELIVPK